ncbi:MAG: hypothetical protein R3F54_24565 [Alphaproteobacteria bacterium]
MKALALEDRAAAKGRLAASFTGGKQFDDGCFAAFDFDQAQHEAIGHLVDLKLGNRVLSADFERCLLHHVLVFEGNKLFILLAIEVLDRQLVGLLQAFVVGDPFGDAFLFGIVRVAENPRIFGVRRFGEVAERHLDDFEIAVLLQRGIELFARLQRPAFTSKEGRVVVFPDKLVGEALDFLQHVVERGIGHLTLFAKPFNSGADGFEFLVKPIGHERSPCWIEEVTSSYVEIKDGLRNETSNNSL